MRLAYLLLFFYTFTLMKTLTLLLCLFLCVPCCEAQNFAVDYPPYQSKNTDGIEITRIVCNDTATILYMEAYNAPDYWVRLSSNLSLRGKESGQSYPVIRSQGFELNKEIYMPTSGNVSFTLQFAPLSPKERTIDFIEGTGEGDWQITGIDLKPEREKRKVRCHLSGRVVNSPQSSRLVLIKSGGDMRTAPWQSIPVKDGKFEYDLYTDIEEAYDIFIWNDVVNNASWMPSTFFAENGTVNFTLHSTSEESPVNLVDTRNPQTHELQRIIEESESKFDLTELHSQMEILEKDSRWYSEAYQEFRAKLEAAKSPEERDVLYRERDSLIESGEAYTPEAREIENEAKQILQQRERWRMEQIRIKPSLAGLYLINERVKSPGTEDVSPYLEIFQSVYEKRYPTHPYTAQIKQLMEEGRAEVGKRFIDFSAPDLNGKLIRLSEQIQGKFAVIDFWASWCGPCRRNSKQMIPIYERYKDKGFTVVGVAREQGDGKAMRQAIEKDGYPWINLIELNDANRLWERYGIGNGGGSVFLVDDKGIIIAVRPSAEEIEEILSRELQ